MYYSYWSKIFGELLHEQCMCYMYLHMAINIQEEQLQLLCLSFELGNPYVFESLTAVIV